MRASLLAVAPAVVAAVLAGVTVAAGPPLARTATAAVQFDAETGKGFAGPADVRAAFGWTAAELRDRARGVSFAYVDAEYFRVVCSKGARSEAATAHTVSERFVDDTVRRRGEAVRGFDLRGYAGATSSTSLHQLEGQRCSGSDADGEFTGAWGPAETTSKVRGLFVRYRDQERPLG